MAGKATVFADRALYQALDAMTKNEMIDLLTDIARAELGEEATNEQVMEWMQPRLNTVQSYRGKTRTHLQAVYDRRAANDLRYIAEHATPAHAAKG